MSTDNSPSVLPSQGEVSAFSHFLSLVLSAMQKAQSKKMPFPSMPPLCGAYSLEGDTYSFVGFDVLYRDYINFSQVRLDDGEIETWVRRVRDKYPSQLDFICFGIVATDNLSKNKEYMLVLSGVGRTNQCFSIAIPIHDKMFENTDYLNKAELIVGYRDGLIPFYGNFSDISH